jgi:glyoxylase-like metal-dependent hydrolase (beta-lactamase superfamily II)/ubiquinone/menaquinone biosynthesis C-methylase UbiE
MSKKASNFQKVVMSWGYRGKEIFKPLNTGWIDDNVACVREWIANIFFYTKNGTTIMIDAGYNYERLAEKMKWLDIAPSSIKDILITHQDTDHVGAVERDSDGLFRNARLYISEIENRYMTGEKRRKVIFGLYKLPMVKSDNERKLLKDGDVFYIEDIKVEAILVPGHTWGHMVYLVDDAYLFTGDTIWFGADGGYSFINALAEDNELSKKSLAKLEKLLRDRGIRPKVITGHTGWSDDLDFVFAHRDQVCNSLKRQKPHDPNAPYDGYDEREDNEERARTEWLKKAVPVSDRIQSAYHDSKNIYDDVLTQGSFLSRQYIRFFWSGTDDNEIARKILAYVPDDFSGTLLDVPVGTAVFTEKKWRRLSKAGITCLDYSVDMLEQAKKRLEDCKNISFIQGDVGKLPLADGSQDIVMSMNGFHAFPDKKKAFKETFRVLKKGGMFVACFYIKGKSKRTDWLVKNILSPKGWFTPPFPTEEQLLRILHKLYSQVEYHVDGSMVYFKCVKSRSLNE